MVEQSSDEVKITNSNPGKLRMLKLKTTAATNRTYVSFPIRFKQSELLIN